MVTVHESYSRNRTVIGSSDRSWNCDGRRIHSDVPIQLVASGPFVALDRRNRGPFLLGRTLDEGRRASSAYRPSITTVLRQVVSHPERGTA
jgi:hypothetical protein